MSERRARAKPTETEKKRRAKRQPEKRPTTKERAVLYFAGGLSVGEVAEKLRYSRRQVQRWLHEDTEFAAALNAALEEVQDAALRLLRAQALEAAQTVVKVMRLSAPALKAHFDDDEVVVNVDNSALKVQLDAAEGVLNRVLGRPALRVTGGHEDDPPLRFVMVHPKAKKKE